MTLHLVVLCGSVLLLVVVWRVVRSVVAVKRIVVELSTDSSGTQTAECQPDSSDAVLLLRSVAAAMLTKK